MARYQDPFRPRPGETFSKRQVDRAGEVLREFFLWETGMELPPRVGEVPRAFATVAWWRSLHAQPLISRVFASAEHGRAVSDALAQELQTAYAKIKDTLPRTGQ